MSAFNIKKLNVYYNGWGEYWPLGTLAQIDKQIVFEFDREARLQNIEPSPLHFPMPKTGVNSGLMKGDRNFYGLPGFIADSLPDGWGLLLMDRALAKSGRNPPTVSVLDRLALLGNTAVGAYSFEPSIAGQSVNEILSLKLLLKEVKQIQKSLIEETSSHASTHSALNHLLQLGGSPQGARPKVLVNFNQKNGQISSGDHADVEATPWLIKFPSDTDHRESCAIEHGLAKLAKSGGIEMPDTYFFDLSTRSSAFGAKRFDRVYNVKSNDYMRVPIQSAAALLHADFRLPSLDYETLLLAALRLTGDQREVLKAYDRCLFNILVHNQDDHSKNFAFCLNRQKRWQLSPAFDITYSYGPGGEHCTSVLGHGSRITRTQLLRLAESTGIKPKVATARIEHWSAHMSKLGIAMRGLPIRPATLASLKAHVQDQRALFTTC